MAVHRPAPDRPLIVVRQAVEPIIQSHLIQPRGYFPMGNNNAQQKTTRLTEADALAAPAGVQDHPSRPLDVEEVERLIQFARQEVEAANAETFQRVEARFVEAEEKSAAKLDELTQAVAESNDIAREMHERMMAAAISSSENLASLVAGALSNGNANTNAEGPTVVVNEAPKRMGWGKRLLVGTGLVAVGAASMYALSEYTDWLPE